MILLKLVATLTLIINLSTSFSALAEVETSKEVKERPSCSNTGTISCPGKLKPTCPKKHKPSCVFVGTMQLPSCLADSVDNTFFSYNLDKISCEK